MDCTSRSVVYHLKPLFLLNTQFQNTSSMYKLKNLLQSGAPASTDDLKGMGSDTTVVCDQDILDRQERLLANLYRLQEDVSAFAKKLKELESTYTVPRSNCFDLFEKAGIRDFVVNADPSYPPYALLWLMKLWEIRLHVTIHKHSSVQSLPENLSVFDKLKSNSISSNSIRMTLVWKKVGENVELIISPIKYKTVTGEVNILRFFDYILASGEDVVQQIRKNEILDLVHRLSHVPSRDQQSIVTQLQKQLGNGTWMCGSAPSMMDAAVWSALVRFKKNTLPTTLNKYVTSCSEFIEREEVEAGTLGIAV